MTKENLREWGADYLDFNFPGVSVQCGGETWRKHRSLGAHILNHAHEAGRVNCKYFALGISFNIALAVGSVFSHMCRVTIQIM